LAAPPELEMTLDLTQTNNNNYRSSRQKDQYAHEIVVAESLTDKRGAGYTKIKVLECR